MNTYAEGAMSELKLKSIENSNLYKRRTTSRENLLHANASGSDYPMTATGSNYANFHSAEHIHSSQVRQTAEGMLYQNTPAAIRNIQYVNSNVAGTNVSEFTANPDRSLNDSDRFGEKHTFLDQYRETTGNGVTGETNIIRDLKSVNLDTRHYQNLPVASSATKPRKMELKDPTGRSDVQVIGFVFFILFFNCRLD